MPTETPITRATSPPLVGFLRGLVISLLLAVLGAVGHTLTDVDLSSLGPWAPLAAAVLVVVVRTVEGWIDHVRGQAPQAGLLGSRPAAPLAYVSGASSALSALDRANPSTGPPPT